MFWNVKFSKKGLGLFILSILALITMYICIFTVKNLWDDLEIDDVKTKHFSSLRNVYYDWTRKLLTDIYVVQESGCNEDDEELFYRVWKGTREYCLADVGRMEGWPLDKVNICPGGEVEARDAVNMASFNGMTICAKKSDEKYLTVTRVDPNTNQCPGVYQPCSNNTSSENTICMHPSLEGNCPITYIAIVEKHTLVNGQGHLENVTYEVSDLSDTRAIIYSKDFDSLPLTKALIDKDIPCVG